MLLHVMPPNMINNEWECVHERKDEECIGNPSVEDLKSLVGDSCEQCNPIRLSRSCTA